ncbi:MAG: DNA repair protein RecN [Ammonifex sp.]|nr:MAG: DNA repair protein RecN [Ammonifex sp.]
MLHTLTIKNFALIEDLTLEFDRGLNVLTGETGAGKSIILAALELALGERATVDRIRTGAGKAVVEAVFTVSEVPACLKAAGIEADEGCLAFRRELYHQGRSTCRINGQTVSLALCREAGEQLIDFLVQGEHREIYLSGKQGEMLDAFAGLTTARLELTKLYRRWAKAKEDAAYQARIHGERLRRADTLRYQIAEIDRAAFREGEVEELLLEKEWLRNAERIVEKAVKGGALLAGQEHSAADMIGEAAVILEEIAGYKGSFKPYAEGLTTATHLIKEAARELERLVDRTEYEPQRIDAVEKRLELFENLRRKYGNTVKDIVDYREEAARELLVLDQEEKDALHLETEVESLRSEWEVRANEIRLARKKSALRLEKEIVNELGSLGMERTLFQVVLRPLKDTPNQHGLDEVEFNFTPNPGEPLKPLTNTASGGEAARTAFALKVLTAANDLVETLFLDEVDTGISGKALEAVAARIEHIAQHRQVLCITHQALIAARANVHHLIVKRFEEGRSVIEVLPLKEEEDRIRELVRLVGGDPETAREHAGRLLKSG